MASINVSLSRPDDESLPGATTTYYGTAVEDSSGGLVSVAIDGQVINSPDLEETTLTIPADDFKEGRYRLIPAPSEGSISVYADGVLMAPEDWTVDGDYLVIPALSGVLGVSVMYSTHVVQGVEPGDLASGSVALVGTPSGEVEAVMRTGDISDETTFTETYPAFTVDGDIITFDGIDNGDSSFSVSYSKEMVLTFTEDNLIPYQTPTDPDGSIIEVEGALWIAELPYTPLSVVLETIDLTESEPVYTETDQFVLAGSMLYIIADAEQYQVSYTVPITEDFMRSELTDDTWTLGALPENGVSVTMDGEAFADYTLDVQTLTFALDPLPEWQITITYDADVVYNGSTDDFDEGKLVLAGDVVDGSVTVYVDNAPAAFTLEENVLTVSSLIKDVSEYEVSFTGLREDNIVELPTGPSVKAGETVTVQVVNGMPMVVSSAGSGDRQESNIEEALTVAANAIDSSELAQQAAEEAGAVANAVNQHFWTDDDGIHVTEVSQESWNDPDGDYYHSGTNQLSNANGILLRDGLINQAQFTPGTVAFYDGNGNEAENVTARFGSDGVHIGSSDSSGVDLRSDSMTVTNPDGENVMKVLASGIQATTRVEVAASSGGFRYMTDPTSYSSTIDVSGATPGSAISWSVPGEFRLGVQASLSNITSTFSGYIVRTGTITPYRYDLYHPTSGTFTAGTSATLSWSISGSYTLSGTTYNVTATYSIDYDATAGSITATATLSGANTSDYIIRWYGPHVVFNGSMDAPSFLLGTTDAALGGFATAVGADVEASGDYSFAEGNGSTASGIYSIAMGHEAEATANSAFALGYHASANGASSTALGGGTVADSNYQTVLGRYNESDPNSDYLFILGNGTADNDRSNALTVDWDGNIAAESFNLWHGQRTLSSADNIDSLFESGIFYLPGSVPGGTYPSGANGQYASLLSMGNTAEYSSTGWVGRQILVQGAGGVWHRSYSGSPRAWTDWKPLDESSHPTEIAASSLTLTGCSLNGATVPAYKIGRHVTINMRVNVTAANPTIAGFPATSGANSHIPVIAYRQSDNAAIAGYMTNAGVVTFPALASGSNVMFHVEYIANS